MSRRWVLAAVVGVVAATACSGTSTRPVAAPPTTAVFVVPATTVTSPGALTTTATTSTVAPTTIAPTPARPCLGAAAPASDDHVVWIWMENHHSVLTSSEAPYERGLAAACGSDTNDAAVGSPSLPNYIGATSGSTWGIGDDNGPGSHPLAVDNLFRQVRASGRPERSYEEAMPAPCDLVGAGEYAVKHDPAAYYVGPGDRAACGHDDVPLGTLTTGALAGDIDAGTLPAFAFVTPDLCNDTHDCSIATGDRWLAEWVPRILAGPNYRAGRTAVFIVWDEPTPMAEVVVALSVRPGTALTARTDHYALLRTTEELLGLPPLGRAASAVDLRPLYGV